MLIKCIDEGDEATRRVAWLAELPLGPTGKVDRHETARRAAAQLVDLGQPRP